MPSDSVYRKLTGDAAADGGHPVEGRRQEPPSQGGMDDSPKPGAGLALRRCRRAWRWPDQPAVPQRARAVRRRRSSRPSAPATLRLERHADVFTLSVSRDGKTWQPVGSVSVTLSDPVYAGLIVCSHDNSVTETAVFSNVDFKSLGTGKGRGSSRREHARNHLRSDGRASDCLSCAKPFRGAELVAGWQLLFSSTATAGSTRFRVTGGEPKQLDTGTANRCNNDHGFSPDGKWLAISDQSRGRLAHLRPPEQRRDAPAGHAPGAVLLARLVAGRPDARLLCRAGRQLRHLHDPGRRRDGASD